VSNVHFLESICWNLNGVSAFDYSMSFRGLWVNFLYGSNGVL
jgi:hypothetical protein